MCFFAGLVKKVFLCFLCRKHVPKCRVQGCLCLSCICFWGAFPITYEPSVFGTPWLMISDPLNPKCFEITLHSLPSTKNPNSSTINPESFDINNLDSIPSTKNPKSGMQWKPCFFFRWPWYNMGLPTKDSWTRWSSLNNIYFRYNQ